MAPLSLTILGSTGSIGTSTLDVVRRHPERYRVFALCAHTQIDRLFLQCEIFQPVFAVVRNASLADTLSARLKDAQLNTEVLWGEDALIRVASLPQVDVVMAAIVGAAGLKPALAAARAGKRLLLANKESLVMAGEVFMRTVKDHGAILLPIDSEHNAIFQSLPHHYSGDLVPAGVSKILLTASGGPFRQKPKEALAAVTPEEACAHPNWRMGAKISVDSATLMNKGLEVIEARWLFNVPTEKIEVVVHPQSIIHSLVQYIDGSVIAELGNPDMRTPIAHALAYPDRIETGVLPLDLLKIANLSFEAPDTDRFPCLMLAYRALEAGGTAPAILNAANEVAVDAFLQRKIAFTAIPQLISETLDRVPVSKAETLESVLAADERARAIAHQIAEGLIQS